MGHSLNSPSSFARRRACPGSARMEDGIKDSESVYAAEGTAAHALGEKCLLEDTQPDDYINTKMGEFTFKDGSKQDFIVDGDMVEAVNSYVNYCKPLFNGDLTKVEKKVKLPFIGEGEKGTADFISLTNKTLNVVDYKHGRGIAVDAFENIQGLCYGLGAANEYDGLEWDKLKVTIVQPRAYHHEGPIRSWEVPREDLLYWKMEIATIAEMTRDPDAPLKASEYCGFCKAMFGCKGIVQFIEESLRMDFENPNAQPVNPDMLNDEEIIDLVFNKIPIIEKWCSKLKDYAQQRAEEKDPLPGSKLVETRATRRWRNVKEAEALLGKLDGAYNINFKTAPQIEKLVGKKKFSEYENLVEKKSTGVTLVPADDPRPSARPTGSEQFGAVDINLFD